MPTLTLHCQYEAESSVIRTDVEAPRLMNGQAVFFDDDHHPVVESNIDWTDTEPSLFAPEEYNLWTQSVDRFNADISEVIKPIEKPKVGIQQTNVPPPTAQRKSRASKKGQTNISEPSLFDFNYEGSNSQPPPIAEVKKTFDASPRPFLSAPDAHLRDGAIVLQNGQVGYLSELKRRPTFTPMDLPYAQLSKLKSYIEIRDCYHRLYDYEAMNHSEDKEERTKLNRLYDAYVARWGYLKQE